MYVSGLKLGFTAADLRVMDFKRLVLFISAWNEMTTTSEKDDGVRMGTQSDIDRLLS